MPICLRLLMHCDTPGGLAGGLDCRQQQRHQNPDDRDHDQQLDERETAN